MPDLGQYAGFVLGAYAAAILLVLALIGISLRRAAQVRARLEDVERRQVRANG